jgi:hypothetical protein
VICQLSGIRVYNISDSGLSYLNACGHEPSLIGNANVFGDD